MSSAASTSSDGPIRVLHVITRMAVGGAQDNTILNVEGLDRERYVVDLACGPGGHWEARARQAADNYFVIDAMKRPVAPLADLRAYRQLSKLIREARYDIVHTHSTKAGILGRLAARRAGVPVVVHTIHSFPFHDFMPAWKIGVYAQAERRAAHWCDWLIAVAELNRDEACAHGIGDPNRMSVIYSGIDLGRFGARDRSRKDPLLLEALGLDGDAPVIGTVGRHDPQKNPQDFVRSARLIQKEFPEAQFVMVGDGELRREVEQLASGNPRIKILGFRSDIPDLLAVLDIFVLSSLWEGLGRAMTEAMASGLPVVAPGINGIPEVVKEGENGILVAAGDPQTLAAGIMRLLRYPDEAREMGERARETVLAKFDIQTMVAEVAQLYERLLSEQRLGGRAR